jgi:hypothetical protein
MQEPTFLILAALAAQRLRRRAAASEVQLCWRPGFAGGAA